jgi:hypothetical protein
MNIPCKAGVYQMPEQVADAYRKIYPSADEQFARMVIWLETHAARRPASEKSAPRFVANWFKSVPRVAYTAHKQMNDLRAFTVQSLTGQRGAINVIDISPVPASADRVGGTDFRADDRRLRAPEDCRYVDWSGAGEGQASVG